MRSFGFSALVLGIVACSSSDGGTGGGTGGGSFTDGGSVGTGGNAGAGYYGTGGSYAGGTGGAGGTAGSSGSVGSGGSGYAGGAGSAGSSGSGGSGGTGEGDAGLDGAAGDPGDAGDASACDGLEDDKPTSFFLSADDSNSMASPAIARRLLVNGSQVPPGLVRTYEFLNYYNIGFPVAPAGTLKLVPELRDGEEAGSLELGIGVVAPAAQKPRRPIVLTLVLDTSGSMGGQPIALEREVVKALAKELEAGDIVSAVIWDTQNAVLLDSHAVTGPSDPALISLANGLEASGGTNLHGGLSAGYQLAQKHFNPTRLNRVVLVSDGQANAGITDETIIGNGAMMNDGDGIYLVGVGVGDGVNDTLMNTVTDAGRGAYVYVDTSSEAHKMMSGRFDEVMDVAARAVQVELRLPWYMGITEFFGEEYSTNPEEIEPQHLAPNDAMFFDQILAPCSASVYSASDPVQIIARWKSPLTHLQEQVTLSTTFEALAAQAPKYLPKGAAIVAYAEALKEPAGGVEPALEKAKALVQKANPAGTDPELKEIATLIDQALSVY